MFLFSGTFYPLEQMPIYLQPIGWVSPLWHATQLGRNLSYGMELPGGMFWIHIGYLALMGIVGMYFVYPKFRERLAR
jgi:lipooligosaccharide transport system permease protein